ncbi:MAG: hypothetical protein ACRDNY_03845 [Gaiellaceae bacterium]
MRRLPARGATLEERIETLLADQRRNLVGQAARFAESARDLERREDLLRDARASLERLLRLGRSDLDTREAELARLIGELTSREERVHNEEAELAQRRRELGAVELKRAALERRERTLADREEAVAAREALLDVRDPGVVSDSVSVAFVPGTAYRLVDVRPTVVRSGAALTIEDETYDVARVGPSPLPGDTRRCAYLVLGPRRGLPSGGSL